MKFRLLNEHAQAPTKANTFDAGWDLYSSQLVSLPPGGRELVSTGVAFDIPQGYVGLIWPRSGTASRSGIDVLGGVVDSGYQGEVKVILINHDLNFSYTAKAGARIAQIVFQPILMTGMIEVEDFENRTTRGDQGFGSTGI